MGPRGRLIFLVVHTRDESMRTVKSLLAAIRNFELSNSGRDQITEERRHNTNWQKDLKSYLDIVQKRDLDSSTAKTSTARSRTDTERSDASGSFHSRSRSNTERSVDNDSLQHRNPSEVRDGDIPRCTNHPSSKTHWTWECNGWHLLPRSKTNRTHQCTGEHSTSSGLVYYSAALRWYACILVAATYARLGFGHAYMGCCCRAEYRRFFKVFCRI
jgi:hypothetical protein